MKYSDRIPVLNSSIPFGGFGRHLTSSECKSIREYGYSCSERWIVVQAYDSAQYGIVYSPGKNGGYSHSGIYVETK